MEHLKSGAYNSSSLQKPCWLFNLSVVFCIFYAEKKCISIQFPSWKILLTYLNFKHLLNYLVRNWQHYMFLIKKKKNTQYFLTFNQICFNCNLILQNSFFPGCTKIIAWILQDNSWYTILSIVKQFFFKNGLYPKFTV